MHNHGVTTIDPPSEATTEATTRATTSATAAGPLSGVKVLELGSFIAGPFAGQLLGDYGADVVKVEDPDSGDPMRGWGVTTPAGDSLWWPTIARNKRSVTADLRTDDGRAFVQRLAAEADVVLENFRPGRLEDWGLDYASIRATNPLVIMVHVSGFGQTGPRAAEAGFGSIGEAVVPRSAQCHRGQAEGCSAVPLHFADRKPDPWRDVFGATYRCASAFR